MKKIFLIIPAIIVIAIVSFILYLKYALPNVGPAPDINVEITKERLERGEYLATSVMGCIDCHTPMVKGKFVMEEAFSGGFEFVLPTGIVRSSNITPDKETGIGGWTEEMFVNRFKMYSDSVFVPHKVSSGFNTNMPWTIYSNMEEQDLKALFAYLHSLEPKKKEVVKFTPTGN